MKKKILFILPHFNVGGGTERAASLLTKKLSERYDIFIVTFQHFKNIYSFDGKYSSFKENVGRFSKILAFLKIPENIGRFEFIR